MITSKDKVKINYVIVMVFRDDVNPFSSYKVFPRYTKSFYYVNDNYKIGITSRGISDHFKGIL